MYIVCIRREQLQIICGWNYNRLLGNLRLQKSTAASAYPPEHTASERKKIKSDQFHCLTGIQLLASGVTNATKIDQSGIVQFKV
jgi:hypothetical protein